MSRKTEPIISPSIILVLDVPRLGLPPSGLDLIQLSLEIFYSGFRLTRDSHTFKYSVLSSVLYQILLQD